MAIYETRVVNTGRVEVEDITVLLRVPASRLEQKRTSAPAGVRYSETMSGDSLTVNITSLNPAEVVSISTVASAPSYLPNRPQISVRGKGVSGKEETASPGKEVTPFWQLVFLPSITVLVSFGSLLVTRRVARHGATPFAGGSGDQQHVLSFLCRIHGLQQLADEYLGGERVYYWSQSDRLGELAIKTNDPDFRAAIKGVLRDLPAYANSTTHARAVAKYNLARILTFEKSFDSARNALDEALKLDRREVEFRLERDELMANSGVGRSSSA